ncbi:MAG: hypothetical protein JNJ83_17175 [Verrucomicrobiaceae bacterium]|nr:hypothetical protein [Verrucomicrobiaceae bacterium]
MKRYQHALCREALFANATSGAQLAEYLRLQHDAGWLERLIPELVILKTMPHRAEFHPEAAGTVWGHIMAALRASESSDPLTNLCIAFHDVGKCCPERDAAGRFTYRGHELLGVAVFHGIQRRLRFFTEEEVRAIHLCIEHHMQSRSIMMQDCPRALVVRLRSSEDWPNLKATMWADCACRMHLWQPSAWNDGMEWVDRLYGEWWTSQDAQRVPKGPGSAPTVGFSEKVSLSSEKEPLGSA